MTKDLKKARWLNIVSLLCAIWFICMGWIWVYFINILVVFPVAILGIFLWNKARKLHEGDLFNKLVGWLYIIGIGCTIAAAFLYK